MLLGVPLRDGVLSVLCPLFCQGLHVGRGKGGQTNSPIALKQTCVLFCFFSGTRISMTLCSLCAAIHHGHSCIYADVPFGQYCQTGATEESHCSPSHHPWRSTCCWNQKGSSTELQQRWRCRLPSRIHTPLQGAGDPGTTLRQPFTFVQSHASLKSSWDFPALLGAVVFSWTERSQLQAMGGTEGGRAGKVLPPKQTQGCILPCFVQPSLNNASAAFGFYSAACEITLYSIWTNFATVSL